EPGGSSQPRHDRSLERLEHREIGKDLDELERARHAQARQPHRAGAADVAVLESHPSGARPDDTRQDIDQGRLAGAVGADDRDELAVADGEAHAVEGAELAVELAEPVGFEDHARPASAGRRRVTNPTSPSGARITITASIAPKISRQ